MKAAWRQRAGASRMRSEITTARPPSIRSKAKKKACEEPEPDAQAALPAGPPLQWIAKAVDSSSQSPPNSASRA